MVSGPKNNATQNKNTMSNDSKRKSGNYFVKRTVGWVIADWSASQQCWFLSRTDLSFQSVEFDEINENEIQRELEIHKKARQEEHDAFERLKVFVSHHLPPERIVGKDISKVIIALFETYDTLALKLNIETLCVAFNQGKNNPNLSSEDWIKDFKKELKIK